MGEKKRILFVDDEPDITRLVAFRLRKEGYEVINAESAEEALRLMHKNPNLILLDLVLPDMDGCELCKRIKADPKFKNIPIIFFTASASDLDKLSNKVREFGAQDYIIKPFYSDELLEKIRKYI